VQGLFAKRENALCNFVDGELCSGVQGLKLTVKFKEARAADVPVKTAKVLVVNLKVGEQLIQLLDQGV
jgi:hypothetical protein